MLNAVFYQLYLPAYKPPNKIFLFAQTLQIVPSGMNSLSLQRLTLADYSIKGAFLIAMFVAAGCSSKTAAVKPDLKNPKPEWLNEKPSEDIYYIGIGHSAKTATNNYIQEAKKSALEDLVSDIKVEVSSSSILSQIDQNKSFQQKYQQIIQTKAADDITEFEQVDSWQDERNYWVYYRLSKQRYKEIKDAQKRDAVTLALDFFTKAKQSEKNQDVVEAMGFYFQGFRSIEKYLADPIQVQFDGKDILLTNEIFANLQSLLDKIQLTATPGEISVNRRIAENGQTVTAKSFIKGTKKPIGALPLRASFEKGAGDVFPDYKTGADGQSKILISKISARDLEQTVGVKVNLLSFSGQDSTAISSLVAAKMSVPKANIILTVQRPIVWITGAEKNFGVDKPNLQLTNQLKNFVTRSGFEITSDKKKAELWMDLDANAEKGAVSGSIYITYVTAVIRVVALKENKEIYSTTLDRIKGFSLDYDRSSQESYNKSLEILERDRLPQLLNAILQ
jgi:LPP20 lipoprotein